MANIRDFVKLFLKELENFTDVWSKTKKQDINDFNRFTKDFGRRAKREPFLSYQVIKDKTALTEISSQIQKDFSHFGKYIDQKISHEMKRGLVDEIPRSQLMERVKREIRQGKRYAYTWVNTSENAINTTKRLNENVESGYKYFQYSGAKPDRDFCRLHFERVYTLEEIKELDNGQGLDVLYYRGGYNCRHRWRPINEKDALALRNAPPPKAGDPPKATPQAKIFNINPTKSQTPTKGKRATTIIRERISERIKNAFGFSEVKLGKNGLKEGGLLRRETLIDKLCKEYASPIVDSSYPLEISFKSTRSSLGYLEHLTRINSKGQRVNSRLNFGNLVDPARVMTPNGLPNPKARVDKNNLEFSTTTHEFSHAITVSEDQTTHKEEYKKYKTFWSGVEEIRKDYQTTWRALQLESYKSEAGKRSLSKFYDEDYLGNYANDTPSEFVAEAFTNYKLSSTPSKYAVKVGELFDENFKRSE